MSIAQPPLYFFNNISYNGSYFNYGLTSSVADSRYLIKVSNDTATSVENFNAGINTSIINAVNPSDNMKIGSSTTNGSLTIGSSSASSQILINKPLIINYTSANYTNISQIGFYIGGVAGNQAMTTGSVINNSFGLGAGTYLINYSLELTISTASITASDTWYGISTTTAKSGAIQTCYNYLHINTMVYNVGDNPVFSGSGVYQATGAGLFYILGSITFTGTGTVQGNLIYKWVRIG